MTTPEPGDPREPEVAAPDLEPDADFPADTAPAETLLAQAVLTAARASAAPLPDASATTPSPTP
jgi:hypothetical protein